jgi:hypothetical protein
MLFVSNHPLMGYDLEKKAAYGKEVNYAYEGDPKPTEGVSSLVKTLTANLDIIASFGININQGLGGRMNDPQKQTDGTVGSYTLPDQLQTLVRSTRETITNLEESLKILNS